MLFQMSVPVKKYSIENALKFTELPFASTSCTIDITSCTVTESSIYVEPCKVHMKSSRKVKKKTFVVKIYRIISPCV